MRKGFLFLLTLGVYGQASSVYIEHADELGGTPERRILRGQVHLRQDTISLFCEEVLLTQEGSFEARGGVRTMVGTTGVIRAARLDYDPQRRLLTYEGDVVADFPPLRFRSPRLSYDRNGNKLLYEKGGILQDTTGSIQSRRGAYDVSSGIAIFEGEVQVRQASYEVRSDSLLYDTHGYMALFPTEAWGVDTATRDSVYGRSVKWYRLSGDLFLSDSAVFWNNRRYLRTRAAYCNTQIDSIEAYCDAYYRGVERDLRGWADSVRWYRDTLTAWGNVSFLERSAQGQSFLQAHWVQVAGSQISAVGDVEFTRFPFQSRSDTLRYDTLLQRMYFWGKVWMADSATQISAQKVAIQLREGRLDSAWAAGTVYLVVQADSFLHFFHQVRGDSATAVWDSLERLREIIFRHQVQGIYYQADGPHWQGAHYLRGRELYVVLDSIQQPAYVRLSDNPQGIFWPVRQILERPLWLRGALWLRREERPRWPFRERGKG